MSVVSTTTVRVYAVSGVMRVQYEYNTKTRQIRKHDAILVLGALMDQCRVRYFLVNGDALTLGSAASLFFAPDAPGTTLEAHRLGTAPQPRLLG